MNYHHSSISSLFFHLTNILLYFTLFHKIFMLKPNLITRLKPPPYTSSSDNSARYKMTFQAQYFKMEFILSDPFPLCRIFLCFLRFFTAKCICQNLVQMLLRAVPFLFFVFQRSKLDRFILQTFNSTHVIHTTGYSYS